MPEEEVEVAPLNQVDRSHLSLQQFMNDMGMVGTQVRSPKIAKPAFHYGDLSVTNYLLWLILGEMMMQNDKEAQETE